MARALQPELLLAGSGFISGSSLVMEDDGNIVGVVANTALPVDCEVTPLPGRALLPGMVNAHSHSFQRLLRGRADRAVTRAGAGPEDFWSWRDVMYGAALPLSPEDVYDVARMAFLEMALAGTTAVGEFHYLHRDPDGAAYSDPNLLAKQVIAAARSVGLRICLLRCAYVRSGFQLPQHRGQVRFFETEDEFLRATEMLVSHIDSNGTLVSVGVAPHSIRAVPLAALRNIVNTTRQSYPDAPIHMHVAEQRGEVDASVAEYGATPVELLDREGLLSDRFTGIHAIHVTNSELNAVARAGATICSCPTTERNLGDGIFPARDAAEKGIRLAFGSDSQAQIAPLEDARQLEYHMRLRDEKRLRLEHIGGISMAARLFGYASRGGAEALRLNAGEFIAHSQADAFTLDLNHISLAGAQFSDLLSAIVFAAEPAAVKDVFVGGRRIVENGVHAEQQGIVERYARVAGRVWQ